MSKQEKLEKIAVPFSNNRIFITFTLFLMIGLPASFIPEEKYLKWILINFIIAVLLTVVNYMIWTKQKHDSKRYFSLHSLATGNNGTARRNKKGIKALRNEKDEAL